MGTVQERVHPRYPLAFKVTMRWRKSVVEAKVLDVSQGGVFVATNAELPTARELVRMELALPGQRGTMAAHGMAVNHSLPGDAEGRPPGVGVQFYALDRDTQRQWSQFIDLVRKGAVKSTVSLPPAKPLSLPPLVVPAPLVVPPPVARPAPVPAPVASAPVPAPVVASAKPPMVSAPPVVSAPPMGAVSRPAGAASTSIRPGSAARGQVEFEVQVGSVEELYTFYERDVSVGGMFLATTMQLPLRSRVKVCLAHPWTGEFFEIRAEVVHIEYDLDTPGVGVQFIDLDEERQEALARFIYDEDQEPAAPDDAIEEVDEAAFLDEPVDARPALAPAPAPVPAAPPVARAPVWDFESIPPPPPANSQTAVWDPPAQPRSFAPEPSLGKPWSKAPPLESELDALFGALDAPQHTGLRWSQQPPVNFDDDAPDFRLSVPDWTSLEVLVAPEGHANDDVEDFTDALQDATPLPEDIRPYQRRVASR